MIRTIHEGYQPMATQRSKFTVSSQPLFIIILTVAESLTYSMKSKNNGD